MDRVKVEIVLSGSGVEGAVHTFPYASYGSLDALKAGLEGVSGVKAELAAPGSAQSAWLVQSAEGSPQLGSAPYAIHYLDPAAPVIAIEDVRGALEGLGTASVQVLGRPEERRFMVRVEEKEGSAQASAGEVIASLEKKFGAGEISVTRTDYVGSRFSERLAGQSALLIGLTLLLILVYASVRFKPQYAVGAVAAIAHDALIMAGFIAATRMQFNTTTIAAILTILGYSINDTIVIFDRIREARRIYPDDSFLDILNRALTETLSRTIITTVTTMLAVLSLYIFTKDSMKDFALALLVGMVSGVYSTIFIACGIVNFWEKRKSRGARKMTIAEAAEG
jgi:preprotein translocase subunit SecF